MIWNGDKVEIIEHEIGTFLISVHGRLMGSLEEWVFSGGCIWSSNMGRSGGFFCGIRWCQSKVGFTMVH